MVKVVLLILLFGLSLPLAAYADHETSSDDDFVILNDALIAPDAVQMARFDPSFRADLGSDSAQFDATRFYQTSEYLIGHVAVGLILPESDGSKASHSEDWTGDEIEQVLGEVQDGLAWWASLQPAAHLSFTLETHVGMPVSLEPITHRATDQRLWISETMTTLGYAGDDHLHAVREYINDLRDRVDSDWAFAIFVVDSSADLDGSFPNDISAHAYIGGPYAVLTYDNGRTGIQNMDAVVAHEMGHIFRALDQYAGSGDSCDRSAGYLYVKNGNSHDGGDCESDEPSIMRSLLGPYRDHAVDHFARGQIGWWDSDGDGILDPVDAKPQILAHVVAADRENESLFRFTGRAWQEPVPSPVYPDFGISKITTVEALVDKTTKVTAIPLDGNFDTFSETYRVEIGPLAPGLHTIEFQAVNSEGLFSTQVVTTAFVYDPIDGALNSSLTISSTVFSGNDAIQFEGVATAAYGDIDPNSSKVAVVQFSIDDGEWTDAAANDGLFDESIEGFRIVLEDLLDGPHVVRSRAIDTNGRVETNTPGHQFQVKTTYTAFLPILQQ